MRAVAEIASRHEDDSKWLPARAADSTPAKLPAAWGAGLSQSVLDLIGTLSTELNFYLCVAKLAHADREALLGIVAARRAKAEAAECIVRGLAASDPVPNPECSPALCRHCDVHTLQGHGSLAWDGISTEDHFSTCHWRLAFEWVKANPEAAK